MTGAQRYISAAVVDPETFMPAFMKALFDDGFSAFDLLFSGSVLRPSALFIDIRFLHYKYRPSLDFKIGLCQILAKYAYGKELHSSKEQYNRGR